MSSSVTANRAAASVAGSVPATAPTDSNIRTNLAATTDSHPGLSTRLGTTAIRRSRLRDENGLCVTFRAGCRANEPSDLGQARVGQARRDVVRRAAVALKDDVMPVWPVVLGDVLDAATDLEATSTSPDGRNTAAPR